MAAGDRYQVATQHSAKQKTAAIDRLIDITIEVAQSRAAESAQQVTLNPAAVIAISKALVAQVQAHKGRYTPEFIKGFIELYLDLAQSTATTQAKACDRDYLEQQMVALLTKLL